MNRFLYKSLILLATLLGAFNSSLAADRADASLKVVTSMDFPPFIADTEPEGGVLSAIVKESFAAAGIEIEVQLIPWRRAYRSILRGDYIASYSWVYSEQRATELHLSVPIFAISNQIITTYGDITDWHQFRKPRPDGHIPILCTPIGWRISPESTVLIDKGMLQKVSPGHPRFCVDLLRANRTNILYMPRMTAAYHMATLQAEDTGPGQRPWPALYNLDIPGGQASIQHVIFTRSAEGLAYKQKFDSGFKALLESGRYTEILDRHLSRYSPEDRESVYRDQKNAGILP